MATITITVTLRKTGGETQADADALTAAVVQELSGRVGSQLFLDDAEDRKLAYTITGVRETLAKDTDSALAITSDASCNVCGATIDNDPHDQAYLYCSDWCRQSANRTSRQHA